MNVLPFKLAGIVLVLAAIVYVLANCITSVDAGEIVVKQSAFDGSITVWTTPGPKWQAFGKITSYKRSTQYSFSKLTDQGSKTDQSILARFNDGGHGKISGTLQYDLPLDPASVIVLHKRFGSPEAIENKVVRTAVERAVYMTGPLMSSKESAAERRSDVLRYVEDQVKFGVYRTRTVEEKIVDPLSKSERTIKHVELIPDPKAPNGFQRQEPSTLDEVQIRAYGFNINSIEYDQEVEGQIKAQQQLAMDVQTAIAKAKVAEQRAITTEQEGKANAAKAEWDQKTITAQQVAKAEQEKAVAVTNAEREKAVAELNRQAAEFKKQEQILLGEGESQRARLMMTANGFLEMKLAAWERVQTAYAAEMGKQQWVPSIVFGASGGNGGNAAVDFMGILGAKAARDLGLDMKIGGMR